MKNVRKYGKAPFTVAVIHGGPGASGDMAPVAKELSQSHGILEPLQTSTTIQGQLQELSRIIKNNGDPPLTFIGHSWGAWLTILYAARYPSEVKKIILVSSGPFEEKYVSQIMETRLGRLNDKEQIHLRTLLHGLNNPAGRNKNQMFAQLGKILTHADSFLPLRQNEKNVTFQYNIFHHVWKEADDLRRSGKLLEIVSQLQCLVVAIHGDYDPHPFEGVEKPLSKIVKDFKFILLKNCGHYPWIEKNAKESFYNILFREL
jgi:pimeloyl-ACP methyl ester carboxylesterase